MTLHFNDLEPCPSRGARVRHASRGELCETCNPDDRDAAQVAERRRAWGGQIIHDQPPTAVPPVRGRVKATLPEPLMDVLVPLAAGKETAEIAAALHLSEHAVKVRVAAIRQALGATTRAHAVAVAYRAGVLDPDPVVLPHLTAAGPPVEKLVAAREADKLTQAQVAALMSRSPAWLCQRESGRQPFTVGEVHRYAQLVGVDLGGQP